MNFQTLSSEELQKNLITTDYRGSEFKQSCLDELLVRARSGRRNTMTRLVYDESVPKTITELCGLPHESFGEFIRAQHAEEVQREADSEVRIAAARKERGR